MSNSVISNSPLSRTGFAFPGICPSFSVFFSWLSRTPHYLELSLSPLSWNQLQLTRTFLRSETLVNISWEVQSRHLLTRMYWKLRNIFDVFMVAKAKSNWMDLLLRMQRNKYGIFVNFRDQTITPEIWCQPRYLEPHYLELFFDTFESSR